MRSTTSQPLSLSDFEISPERDFLPSDPCETLPDCPTLNHPGRELPKLLSTRRVRQFIDEQPSLRPSVPLGWRDEECRAAMRILSFAGHAYAWKTPGQPATTLPSHLTQPWYETKNRDRLNSLSWQPMGQLQIDIVVVRVDSY